MQEEVTQKTIALSIRTGRLTGRVLQAALRKFLQTYRKKRDTPHKGKQTLRQLMKHNAGVTNIEITDQNIKAFSHTAKKYGIDFSLKKDTTAQPPRYLVFFKGRDVDVLQQAFREFTAKNLTQEQKKSVRRDLSQAKQETKTIDTARDKVRDMDRGANYEAGHQEADYCERPVSAVCVPL